MCLNEISFSSIDLKPEKILQITESFILGNGSCPYIPSEPLPYPTPSPINIVTSKIQAMNTSTPLVIRNGLFGPLLVKNDGYARKI